MLAHWNKLRCKRFSPNGVGNETWHHLPGVWELWLLQGGKTDVGWDLNPTHLDLHSPTRRTAPHASYDMPPTLATTHTHNTHTHVAQWWKMWQTEVDLRNTLIRHTPTNWDAVVSSLYRSNTLLLTTRDRKMQRAVRLSHIGVHGNLTEPSKGIYMRYLVPLSPT